MAKNSTDTKTSAKTSAGKTSAKKTAAKKVPKVNEKKRAATAALRSGNPQKRAEVVETYKKSTEETLKAVKLSKHGLNPAWLIPLMLGLFIIGIAWVVIFYMTAQIGGYPIPALKYGNFVVGFGFILAGFGLSTRWR